MTPSRIDDDLRAAPDDRARRPGHLRHRRRSDAGASADLLRRARRGGRRRPRSGRAVLGSARRRPGDPARHANARSRRHDAARHARHRPARPGRRSRRRSCCSPMRTRCCAWTRRSFARDAADAGVDGVLILDYPVEEAGAAARAAPRRRARSDLPDQPDDDRRAHPPLGGARARVSLCDLAARRHRRPRQSRRRRRRAGATRVRSSARRCRWRWASASRRPEHVAQACASPTRRSSAARSCRSLRSTAEQPMSRERAGDYVRWLKSACERPRRPPQADRRDRRAARPAAERARGVRARDRAGRRRPSGWTSISRRGKRSAGARPADQSGPLDDGADEAAVRADHRRGEAPGADAERRVRLEARVDDRGVASGFSRTL